MSTTIVLPEDPGASRPVTWYLHIGSIASRTLQDRQIRPQLFRNFRAADEPLEKWLDPSGHKQDADLCFQRSVDGHPRPYHGVT